MYNTNLELRSLMILSGVRQRDIASALKMQESTLSRLLKNDLTPENRQKIIVAIQKLSVKRV